MSVKQAKAEQFIDRKFTCINCGLKFHYWWDGGLRDRRVTFLDMRVCFGCLRAQGKRNLAIFHFVTKLLEEERDPHADDCECALCYLRDLWGEFPVLSERIDA